MSRSTSTGLPVLQEGNAISLDRRDFCAFAAACALMTAAGCNSSEPPTTGPPESDASNGAPPDAAASPDGHADAASEPDATPVAGACSMPDEYADCGPPSQFELGHATFFDKVNFFVVRDAAGLYALSSKCTHQGAPLQQLTDKFHCHAHLSNFTLNGEVINGPAMTPLNHYDTCILPNGNIGVKNSVIVDPSARLLA